MYVCVYVCMYVCVYVCVCLGMGKVLTKLITQSKMELFVYEDKAFYVLTPCLFVNVYRHFVTRRHIQE
jgi:hypothetical protein